MARVQISLDDEVLTRIDTFAKSVGLSRSSFLSMAALDYISAKEKAPIISSTFAQFASLLDARVRGVITDEELSSSLDALEASTRSLQQ